MKLHADMSLRAIERPDDAAWVPSPLPGVTRRMLERDGGEVARATSVVRYAPQSRFSAHEHGLGEEFLVLDGTFSDEHGDYPRGVYVRNPPGSLHTPFSVSGCTLLVKLRQFDPGDRERVVIDTRAAAWQEGRVPGISVLPLHRFGGEIVQLQRWQAATGPEPHVHADIEEVYVLDGGFADELGIYPADTWLRNPPASSHAPISEGGCLLYVKTRAAASST